eukprot:CAMPEP_0194310702 /NCGR_PEP_ID=MMETSP0171-20130528/7672_1 /TAXON_ID=218684 /ORGANISM="Corethron pennatum, Strain L29A3" /LENGTH=75 /DNA_ID=CAMNT_0039064465 /DNA_START=109 /DNA_END=332 /DNA_ORIENTATION=+
MKHDKCVSGAYLKHEPSDTRTDKRHGHRRAKINKREYRPRERQTPLFPPVQSDGTQYPCGGGGGRTPRPIPGGAA